MSEFLDRMKACAKADRKTIVLPEGEDPRTIAAAKMIVEEGLANLIILGDPAAISVEGVQVVLTPKGAPSPWYVSRYRPRTPRRQPARCVRRRGRYRTRPRMGTASA